jgi:hypothetical protein
MPLQNITPFQRWEAARNFCPICLGLATCVMVSQDPAVALIPCEDCGHYEITLLAIGNAATLTAIERTRITAELWVQTRKRQGEGLPLLRITTEHIRRDASLPNQLSPAREQHNG